MILLTVVITLAVLALVTQIGVAVLERQYPAQGQMIDVAGGRLNVLDIGPRDAPGPPIVMIHGASSNLGTMRVPLGDMLARDHRVILIDRPGLGWSTRDGSDECSPAQQAAMIDEALTKLGIGRAILVVHSLAGVLGASMALDHPQHLAGLVMLAGVAYPWPGGVGRYNKMITLPVVGKLLAYTITLPLGLLLTAPGTRGIFLPQSMPEDYVRQAAIALVLRPRAFIANAWDLVTLKAAVIAQAPRYGGIKLRTLVITGETDSTVSPDIHSRRFAATVPDARLIVLPGVGHMVQNAAPDLIIGEIESMIAATDIKPKAALR